MHPAAASSLDRALLPKVHAWTHLIVRVVLAFFFISYGIAKLLGTQFIRSGWVLDVPVSELSGFALTWVYFGYAPLYSHVIAAGQIVFAGMLLFERTRRLAALGLLAIVVNIVLVNFSYHISPATKVVSSVFLAMNLYLVLADYGALKRFFWDETASSRASAAGPRLGLRVGAGVLLVAVTGSVLLLSWVRAQFMDVTPLSGDWLVQEVLVDGTAVDETALVGRRWEKVYFESEGRFGVRTADGIMQGRYRVDPADEKVALSLAHVATRFGPPPEAAAHLVAAVPERPQPIELTAAYRLATDRTRLDLGFVHDGRRYDIALVPWKWQKY